MNDSTHAVDGLRSEAGDGLQGLLDLLEVGRVVDTGHLRDFYILSTVQYLF